MKIIPVLAVRDGIAVAPGVSADAGAQRPLASVLAPSAEPLEIARAVRDRLGLVEIHLADLDARSGAEPAWELYRALHREEFTLIVEAGPRDRHLALALLDAGVRSVVVGIGSYAGREFIPELLEVLGPRRLVLAIDLRDGRPLGDPRGWGRGDAPAIARAAAAKGVRRFLVRDLAQGAGGTGPALDPVREVAAACPGAEVLAGGGVRGPEDLVALADAGAAAAVVGAALHGGRIDRASVAMAAGLAHRS